MAFSRCAVFPFRDVVVNGWKDIGIRNDVNGVRKTVNHIRLRHRTLAKRENGTTGKRDAAA